ncbi:alpha/beta fold hydrolase [Streptomyces paludis]|nr:alpha/beta hydrolase [Streptomyces paludis]
MSGFKNDKARARFYAVYERALEELLPEPRTVLDIPTAFGTTRAYRVGPPSGEPIVLLSGASGNALMWHRYIPVLARHRTVIAVDTVGEPGLSVQSAPIDDGRDGAAWLAADRSAGLTLVDPAGFAVPGRRFYTWVIAGALAGMAPCGLRPRLARMVGNSAILESELMRLGRASVGFRRVLPPAEVFSDEELGRLCAVPSQFLLGARSTLHDAPQVAARIGALVPSARVEVVADAGHALPTDQPDLVAERILEAAGAAKPL